jgi:hypothetical protein
MRVLLVTSPGGHQAQLEGLRPWFRRHTHTWVGPAQVALQVPGEEVSTCAWPTTRSVPAALRNTALAWRMLRTGRYDVIVSTGAAVAVPFFVVARLLGIPTAYIECLDRMESPSLSARLCRPLATVFCVQLEDQADLFPSIRRLRTGRSPRATHVIGALL